MKKLTGMLVLLLMAFSLSTAFAKEHNIVLHIDENDKNRMNLVLNNAANLNKYYQDKGDESNIEIVAYGPGLKMYTMDSPVKKRIASFEQNFENISFKACANTHRKMSKKAGKDIKLLSQAKMVDSGAVHLVQRQEEGWSYLRP